MRNLSKIVKKVVREHLQWVHFIDTTDHRCGMKKLDPAFNFMSGHDMNIQ